MLFLGIYALAVLVTSPVLWLIIAIPELLDWEPKRLEGIYYIVATAVWLVATGVVVWVVIH